METGYKLIISCHLNLAFKWYVSCIAVNVRPALILQASYSYCTSDFIRRTLFYHRLIPTFFPAGNLF